MKTAIKILLVIVLGIMMNVVGKSQEKSPYEDIKIGNQFTINKVYAGILANTDFTTDSLSCPGINVAFRVGVKATWKPAKWFSVSGWTYEETIYQKTNLLGVISGWNAFWLTFTPAKWVNIQIGQVPSIAADQRPLPLTANGQFESQTEQKIPGAMLGAQLIISPFGEDKNISLGAGVFLENSRYKMYQMNLHATKILTFSGWYSEKDSALGAALTFDTKYVYSTSSLRQNSVIGNFIQFNLPKDFQIYSDNVFDQKTNYWIKSETGILKHFSSKWINGFFGICYDYEKPIIFIPPYRVVRAYLFVHL